MPIYDIQRPMLQTDFNGVFGDFLCLSHSHTCIDENGIERSVSAGDIVTAFDHDEDDDGNRDWIIATGVVVPSSEDMACRGSVWAIHIDDNGFRHESDLEK